MKNLFRSLFAFALLFISLWTQSVFAETIENTDESDKYCLHSQPSFVDYADESVLKALDFTFHHDLAIQKNDFVLPNRKLQHSFYFIYINGKGYVLWSSIDNNIRNSNKKASTRVRLYGLAHLNCLSTTRSLS